MQAVDRAQCVAHLGIVHIGESGAAEPDYEEYSYGSRWNRYRDYEDDEDGEAEDEDDDESASFTAVTVDDSWQYVDEWRDIWDRAVEFGPIPLADGELLPEGALDEEPPDKKRLTEASGNEGASYERSYHRAAASPVAPGSLCGSPAAGRSRCGAALLEAVDLGWKGIAV